MVVKSAGVEGGQGREKESKASNQINQSDEGAWEGIMAKVNEISHRLAFSSQFSPVHLYTMR